MHHHIERLAVAVTPADVGCVGHTLAEIVFHKGYSEQYEGMK